MKTKDFSFVNIVPVKATCPEFAVSEIRRQHKEVGLTKFALMLTLQPMGFPAKDNADRIISTAAKVMEELNNYNMFFKKYIDFIFCFLTKKRNVYSR